MKKKKQKVLLFVDRMRVGGIQILLYNLYPYLVKCGLEVEFLLLDDGEQYELEAKVRQLGAVVHKLDGIWLRGPMDYIPYGKGMNQFFKEHHDYCAVHMNSGSKNFLVLFYAKKYSIPVRIAHSHNTNFQSTSKSQILLGNMLKKPLKRYATNLFACSKYAGEWLFGKKAMDQGKVTVIPNGIELDKFRFCQETRRRIREELGVTNEIVIGHVGRFTTQKNHEFLIDIFAQIHKQNQNTVLVLAGIGELMEQTKQKVNKLQLESSVKFLGFRKDVTDVVQGMDVFLMPSLYEGFPVTAVEAQASGLPCVFSDSITKEAKILDQVSFVKLEDTLEKWSEKTLELVGAVDREHCTETLREKGFDIYDMAKTLKTYYVQEIGK